jgi:hypothetical protein
VLSLLARGLSNTELAGTLHVSIPTVKTHVSRILTKLAARDRARRQRGSWSPTVGRMFILIGSLMGPPAARAPGLAGVSSTATRALRP